MITGHPLDKALSTDATLLPDRWCSSLRMCKATVSGHSSVKIGGRGRKNDVLFVVRGRCLMIIFKVDEDMK